MSVMRTTLSGVGLVADDLDDFPEDGHRYELVDDLLLVSAAPSELHQVMATNLLVVLALAAPPTMRVLTAPVDVRFAATRQLQPDLLVRAGPPPRAAADRRAAARGRGAVAEHPPSRPDPKRQVYAEGGVASYWVCDPGEPSVTVLELVDGDHVQTGRAVGQQVVAVTAPYALELVPAHLVR